MVVVVVVVVTSWSGPVPERELTPDSKPEFWLRRRGLPVGDELRDRESPREDAE